MDVGNSPNLALGTAGHIDHGKSALVMALTGTDPDRLEEEKRRGITIELGFVELELPDGRKMTVVDVPGHERFVRQMIIGAAGIDVALLVIAADDGVMPQTTEHVAVLQTLGIKSCVVALTKIDMVDPEWVDLVEEEVRAFLSNTPFANARIVRCSSRTGEGVEDVRQAIAAAVDDAPKVHQSLAFRQPVHRVFSVKGAGTVITGVVWSGSIKQDDVVEVLPSGKRGRVRGVQVYGRKVKEAVAGNCVAVNLNDVKADDVSPGDFIATPGVIQPTDRFDCHFTYMDTSGTGKPLVSGVQMHIAHGAKEVLGRVLFADGQAQLGPGQSCYAQV
ncbi:MAG: selenocysteine-specific translation elongation factor, partial [Eggerthellaceae bacterium]|nr:selenocysteine-specific translation elongation factor [Eggerthellaceae bacterium]